MSKSLTDEQIEKRIARYFYIFLLVGTLFICMIAYRSLQPSFEAIAYLESEGYTHVRILYSPTKGHGCQADDVYKRVFDAYAPGEEERSQGIICKTQDEVFYEE